MKRERKTFIMPVDLIERIVKYQKENYHNSMTAAVIELIVKGLEK